MSFLLLAGIVLAALTVCSGTYVVSFPNALIPGLPLEARVLVQGATGDVNVSVELRNTSNQATVLSNTTIAQNGVSTSLKLNVPGTLLKNRYEVVVSGSGGLAFQNSSNIHFEDKGLLVFIQTDKSRYSAGQTVKYRAALLLSNLQNFQGQATTTIEDGNSNRIEVIGPNIVEDGVLFGAIELSTEPVFGKWKIKINAVGKTVSKSFEVNDYILPRFNVHIVAPASVNVSHSSFDVSVIARFTFRSDVHGNCTLLIYNEGASWKHIEKHSNISGTNTFTLQMTELKNVLDLYSKVNIRATVMDHATYLSMTTEKQLNIDLNRPEAVTITKLEPYKNSFVSGLNYNTKLFVERKGKPIGQSGTLSVTPTSTTAVLKTCYKQSPSYQWLDVQDTVLSTFTIAFDETGYADLNYQVANSSAQKLSFKVVFNDQRVQSTASTTTITLYALQTNNMPVIRMKSNIGKAIVGDSITLSISSTEMLTGNLTFEIHSRGAWLTTETVSIQNVTTAQHSMTVTKSMIPQAYITVSHLTSVGQLIADYSTLEVEGDPFYNQVNISCNPSQLQPGENIDIRVNADPLSTVYLLVEDERNRIIGTENDIFKSDVIEELGNAGFSITNNINSFRNSKRRKRYVRSNSRSITKRSHGSLGDLDDIFIESGLVVLSDAKVMEKDLSKSILFQGHPKICIGPVIIPQYNEQNNVYFTTSIKGDSRFFFGSKVGAPAAKPTNPPGLSLSEVVRSKFPETWIWDKYSVGESGVLNITQQVPDSITTWVTSAFATNAVSGFGIAADKIKFIVQKKFFITLDLPREIVLGEEFLLQITVFNYDIVPKQVFLQVTLSENPHAPIPAVAQVPVGEGKSTFVLITPTEVGTLSIEVMARVGFFSFTVPDVVSKTVNVRPGGVQKSNNEQVLLDVNTDQVPFTKTIVLTDPPNMVPGTKLVKITITGNFMIPSVEGLGNLIRLPYGCGEQTMLNFAPAIYITKYLTTVGKLTADIQTKSTASLKKGLQNELNYQRSDGSFSAFGNSDSSGSSWLTAFVLKCFGQAHGLINIDNSIMSKGMNWLLRCQTSSGDFSEPGRVIHYQMQAGTRSGLKRTAFILISLLENRHTSGVPVSTLNSAIVKSRSYLEARLYQADDVYSLAIVCYALVSANSTSKSSCYTKLNNAAISDDEKMYWEASRSVAKRAVGETTLTTRAPSADIEASSYALLTYIKLGKLTEGFQVVKWLVSQRNPQGGWTSTQDTIISLQALTEFSSRYESGPSDDYGVQFNVFSFQGFVHSYSTTGPTIDVMHTQEVPGDVDNFIVQATGNGLAVLDITTFYYVSGNENNDYISVNATITSESIHSITVKSCLTWTGPHQSGMLIIEVEMPTGFQADSEVIKGQAVVKKHETRGRDFIMYFDGVSQSGSVCANVKMNRVDPVVKSQACHVTAYDYYEPSHQAIVKYESGFLKSSNICDVCPLCQFCTEGQSIG